MKECGLPETEAMLIASITEGFTFNMLDALSLAFNAIKKGVKAECL
jgi:hypothetical protein|tara:strand:- start:4506 stop:4643 length:138 start_codon:yes stop_codon:yes gene_type:complete